MKLLIKLEIPSIAASYNVFVPDDLPAEELTPLLAKGAEDLSWKQYISSGTEYICLRSGARVLQGGEDLYAAGVHNGDTLLLI